MIGEKEFCTIRDRVFTISGADETEVVLGGGCENLTRFGENRITQNVSEERYDLRVRVRFGRRQGVATTNDFSDGSLENCVAEATALAKVQEESERVLDFHQGDERTEDVAWSRDTAEISAATRAEWVRTAVEVAEADGLEVGGIALTSEGTIEDYGQIGPFAVANTTGLYRFGSKTRAVFEVSAKKGAGAGRARILASSAGDVDAAAVARDACRRALESQDPTTIPPGSYTVVFEAEAVIDLLFYLGYLGMNGMSVAEKRSPLWDKLGEKVFGDNFNLTENPDLPGLFGISFDGEGVDTNPLKIVENGVIRSFVHDRLSAHLSGQTPTGHGLPQPNSWGAFMRFPVIEGGDESLEDLIAGVDNGVLVTRLWYTNVVDPMRMMMTGMTRDGTFRIENGKLGGPVKNFRYNQSLLDFFSNIEALGRTEVKGEVALPAMRVRNFNFSSGTDF
ncbi:MAG: TldD/PmbA family protein [bacterium]|nr:TldD/PmbA family protein [bacterium]